jgi:hypothetical protein
LGVKFRANAFMAAGESPWRKIMDKKIAGLLGSVAALATAGAAQAATPTETNPSEALRASSYADLLTPISNAQELLIADDNARASKPAEDMKLAQVSISVGHHHHHHHRYHRRVIIKRHHRHHHHHHHHHHSNYMAVPRGNV